MAPIAVWETPFASSCCGASRFAMPPTRPESTTSASEASMRASPSKVRARSRSRAGLPAVERGARSSPIVAHAASAEIASQATQAPIVSASRPVASGPARAPAPPIAIAMPIAPAGRRGPAKATSPQVQMIPSETPNSARPASSIGKLLATATSRHERQRANPPQAISVRVPSRSESQPSGSETSSVASVAIERSIAVCRPERWFAARSSGSTGRIASAATVVRKKSAGSQGSLRAPRRRSVITVLAWSTISDSSNYSFCGA